MEPQDVEYYERRAQQEREKAKLTLDTAVARVHVVMAEEYERRARAGRGFRSISIATSLSPGKVAGC